MLKHSHVALALVCWLGLSAPAFARGIGTWSYLVTSDGQLAASLGETRSELLDAATSTRFRYREGRISAVPLDKPDQVLWSAVGKFATHPGGEPVWRLTPELLVVAGAENLYGIERASGKIVYATATDNFTRSLHRLHFTGTDENPPRPTLYLIDEAAQTEQAQLGKKQPTVPARIARFDLVSGKFQWKTPILTPAGKPFYARELDPRGVVRGEQEEDDFWFDPASGKGLDKASFVDEPRAEKADAPSLRARTTADKIDYHDAEGRLLWSRVEPGAKGTPLRAGETLLVPTVSDRSKVTLVALNVKDGAPRWRLDLPNGPFADSVTVDVQAAKTGYLVQVHWIVLD